jgi:predicted DNA-binding transcriptional regulator AlpA
MTDEGKLKSKLRKMLTAEQVLELIPVCRSTLFRLGRDKLFPRGQAITPHRKLWFEDEVVTWQQDLQDSDSALAHAMRSRAQALMCLQVS